MPREPLESNLGLIKINLRGWVGQTVNRIYSTDECKWQEYPKKKIATNDHDAMLRMVAFSIGKALLSE